MACSRSPLLSAESKTGSLVWFAAAAGLCLFGMVNLVFDYARIQAVAGNNPKAWRAAIAALRFVLTNRAPTAGLYIALWLLVGMGIAAYLAVARFLGAPVSGAILALFLVRQFAALGKVCLRLLFYSAQCEMFDALNPEVAVAAVEAPAEPAEPAAEFSVSPEIE